MEASSSLSWPSAHAGRASVAALSLLLIFVSGGQAQQAGPPSAAAPGQATSKEELLKEIRALRQEVAEALSLEEQMGQLRQELTGLQRASLRTQPVSANRPGGGGDGDDQPAIGADGQTSRFRQWAIR